MIGLPPRSTLFPYPTLFRSRRALILALGGVRPDRAPDLVPVLVGLYDTDPDPGIHAAAGWVLRRPWGRDRKSTRLNASHTVNSDAVFCFKKKARTHAIGHTA